MSSPLPLLEIDDLFVHFPTSAGVVRAVDGVSLSLEEGDALCLVGESGSGKTVVALAVMGLLPPNAVVRGSIRFDGRDLLALPRREMQRLRGREIGMVFEQPWSCLNPTLTVGEQIAESVATRHGVSRRAAKDRAQALMALVGISAPTDRYRQYPGEFSGGMQQRAMIAIAVAGEPRLLIADEPTTALDVTVQAQILDLLLDVAKRLGTTLLLITHDVEVGAVLAGRMAVMYAGEVVEVGGLQDVTAHPRHPYTNLLMHAIDDDGLHPIPGAVPELTDLPPGCRFNPRCPYVMDCCLIRHPELEDGVRCHLHARHPEMEEAPPWHL